MTRLWSIHPSYLDQKALQACWREGLGAQKAIKANLDKAKCGYQHHSALARFMATNDPLAAIGWFLVSIQEEAERRGYKYNRQLILEPDKLTLMTVTQMQSEYEWWWLGQKLAARSERYRDSHRFYENRFQNGNPVVNPIFSVLPGFVEEWEKMKCGVVTYVGLGKEKQCGDQARFFLDWGSPNGYPVCDGCVDGMHSNRVRRVQAGGE